METTDISIDYLQIIVGFLLLGGLSFIAIFFENKTKPKLLFDKKHLKLFEYAIMLFVTLTGILWFLKSNNLIFEGFGILLLGIKIVISLAIANEADKLGRNKYLWGFLSFLEYHCALIALGLNPKLIKADTSTSNQIRTINKTTIEQESNIKSTNQNGIIDNDQKQQKLAELKESYENKISEIMASKQEQTYTSQLENALKSGIITQKEYNDKLKKR